MSDDLTKSGAPDRIRININQYHERVYWTKAFGIKQALLREACKAAGPMVVDVKAWLMARIEAVEPDAPDDK